MNNVYLRTYRSRRGSNFCFKYCINVFKIYFFNSQIQINWNLSIIDVFVRIFNNSEIVVETVLSQRETQYNKR